MTTTVRLVAALASLAALSGCACHGACQGSSAPTVVACPPSAPYRNFAQHQPVAPTYTPRVISRVMLPAKSQASSRAVVATRPAPIAPRAADLAPRAVAATAPSSAPRVVAAPAAPVATVVSDARAPMNATCPVMLGNPVNRACTSVWNGRVVGFSDRNAKSLWDRDPVRFSANLPWDAAGRSGALPPPARLGGISATISSAVIPTPVPAAAAPAHPCETDADCEGEMECEGGQCRLPGR